MGGWKFRLAVQQSAQIQKASINITASKYFSKSCHLYLIYYLCNSTKVLSFCRFLLETLKGGGPNMSEGAGKLFEKNK